MPCPYTCSESVTISDSKSQRHSLRLKDYGYDSPGAYFVTTCAYRRQNIFGEIEDGVMRRNRFGEIVSECFVAVPEHCGVALIDELIVMPNHVHGIVIIRDVGARHAVPGPSSRRFGKPAAASLAAIVGSFKSATTKRINQLRRTPGAHVWQRNYYEHVVRGDDSLNRIREYIAGNPARWDVDRENPSATRPEAQFAWRA